jgi:hypothetical protein
MTDRQPDSPTQTRDMRQKSASIRIMRMPFFGSALAFYVNSGTARTDLLSSAQGRSSKPGGTLITNDHGVSQITAFTAPTNTVVTQ